MDGGGVTRTRGRLRFGLLGPVEAWRDGEQLRLGGERQRGLLARLLLSANELVTVDRLVEELFGSDAHDDGLRSLRVAVSRLRRLLEDGEEADVLITRPGGYELRLGPQQLDLSQFESLLLEGRQAADKRDFLSASVTLREALGLWRGPPLADLSGLEFAQGEIRRLEELHVAAHMDRIEADLALGRHAQVIGELETLVVQHPLQERARGQLMLALYRSGRQADALAVYRDTSDLLRSELGLEPSRALQELERSILRQAPELDLTPPASAPRTGAVCPFKGLASFERGDAEYFCGREALVTDLVALAASSGLVGLVGPSGVGKSSALRAGLLSALADGALPGSAAWPQVVMRPGADPNNALKHALGGRTLPEALDKLEPGRRLVLAVDQLEELFTAGSTPETRETFLSTLVGGAEDRDRCLVLVALRADFYGRSVLHPLFARRLNRSHVLAGPMDRAELRRAIEEPARRAGLEVEPALTEALVSDVAGQSGGLPLLSTALLELWQARDGNVLTYESYRSRGGVGGAVARLAEAAYRGLEEDDRGIARTLLLRLTTGDEASLVRRRVPLAGLAGQPAEQRLVGLLTAERLLTVTDGEVEISHEALIREWPRYRDWIEEDRVERRLQAHLTAQAREWDGRGRDRADLYRGARLTAALEWSSTRAGDLGPTEREFLAASEEQADLDARRQRARNRRLRGLLVGAGLLLVLAVVAIVIAVDKQQSASDAARVALGRQLGAEAVSEPRIDLAMLLAREAVRLDPGQQTDGTLLATLLRSPAALASFTFPIDARPQSVALSPDGHTLAVPDNDHNIRLFDIRTRVQRAILRDAGSLDPPTFSLDGSRLLYIAVNPKSPGAPFVAVRDAHDLALRQRLEFDRRFPTLPTQDILSGSVLVSPDDRTVYYAYWFLNAAGAPAGAFLDRWSLPSGRLLDVTPLGSGPLLAMRLTGRGNHLAVLRSRRFDVYDARSMQHQRSMAVQPGSGEPTGAAISADGSAAVVGSATGSVSFVNLLTGQTRLGVGGHSAGVARAAYSPNGQVAVTTGEDDKVIIWDARSGTQLETLIGHAGPVHGAAISSDGQTLFTSSLDGQVLEWDLGNRQRFGRPFSAGPGYPDLSGNTPGTPPLAMSPDGSEFAVRLGTQRVGIFSTTGDSERLSFPVAPRAAPITALAWSPRGSELAVSGQSGTVQLWSVRPSPRLVRSFVGLRSTTGLPEGVQTLAFGRQGSLLAAADINHTPGTGLPLGHLAVWSTATGKLLHPPLNLGEPGDSLAFSPDSRTLAAGLDDGPAWLIDVATGHVVHRLRPIGLAGQFPIGSVAFAPNGTLATGSWAGIVQLWNPATGRAIAHPILVAAAPVASLAFDRSGQIFSTTGGTDGTAKLWFTSSLQLEGSLQGDDGHWGNAVFSPDGNSLTVVYDDGRAFQWPTSVAAWTRHACAVADRNLTREEWDRFVSGHAYAHVCP